MLLLPAVNVTKTPAGEAGRSAEHPGGSELRPCTPCTAGIRLVLALLTFISFPLGNFLTCCYRCCLRGQAGSLRCCRLIETADCSRRRRQRRRVEEDSPGTTQKVRLCVRIVSISHPSCIICATVTIIPQVFCFTAAFLTQKLRFCVKMDALKAEDIRVELGEQTNISESGFPVCSPPNT